MESFKLRLVQIALSERAVPELPRIHSLQWRHFEAIELIENGEHYFPRLINACDRAKTSIHISMYWFESGHVANQLIASLLRARARGVSVSCLLDQIGSFDLSSGDQQRLERAGVNLGWYNPIRLERLHLILRRDHSKIFLIDHRTLFIGGTGIADEFLPSEGRARWRENMFQIEGSIVLDAMASLQRKWKSKDTIIRTKAKWPRFKSFKTPAPPQKPRAAWIESTAREQRQILRAIIKAIQTSQQCVCMATAYFAPDPQLRFALKRAARRGLRIQLLVPGPHADHPLLQVAGQYYYHGLLNAGVAIYEYQPTFMHSKYVICDDLVCFGSSNLDIYTQRWSLEANMLIEDNSFAQKMRAMFSRDLEQSVQINTSYWQQQTWPHKIKVFLAYKIACWIAFLSNQWALISKI